MKFRLSDICDIKVGFPFKSNGFNENGDGVRLVRGMNISKNGFRWGNQTRWWNNVTHDLDDYFLKENDVLVAMDGNVSTNFVNVSKEDLPLLLVQRVARLRSKIKPSNIIWYIVKSPNFGAYLNSVKTGTTISHISSKQIGDFEVDLPDFEYLENVCTILSTLDDKIKRNNQINDNLSKQAALNFRQELLKFDSIPNGWQIASLSDIADYLNGLAMQKFRPVAGDDGIPVLKIKELRQGFCDADSDRCRSDIPKSYIIRDGDVIFSWSGSLLVDFWTGGICGLNQHLFKVTSKRYDPWFYYVWTKYHLNEFSAIASGMATTMGHIKRGELSKAKVCVPSKEDYQKIGEFLNPIYRKIVLNRIENNKLILLRDSLLPKLLNGEIY